LIIQGVRTFRQKDRIDHDRQDPSLADYEKTTELFTTGVYGYIRYPFYSSLLFLAWGIVFKQITWLTLVLGIAAIIFLIITAKKEET
jgi:protein-S-isoprenylcysteine O-methyltransferase Ste14